jgi:hypothetical protein
VEGKETGRTGDGAGAAAAPRRRPFPGLNEGEDTRWVFSLPAVHAMRDASWFAAMVHAGNTSPKQTRGPHWHPIALDLIRSMMGPDWSFYAALADPAPRMRADRPVAVV